MSILLVEYVEFTLRLAERYAVMEGGLISHSGDTDSVDLTSFGESCSRSEPGGSGQP